MNINSYGFVRVAAATIRSKVGDCAFNVSQIKSILADAASRHVQVVCFPEMCITGYTCGDLFFQKALLSEVDNALLELTATMRNYGSMIAIVGLPLSIRNSIYNAAAVISSKGVMGLTLKSFIPNGGEYYEKRWFARGNEISDKTIVFDGKSVAVGTDLLFATPEFTFGVEICHDLWMPSPPSGGMSIAGAEIIFNPSASNELVGKHNYRRSLVTQQSGRCMSGYIYASVGASESSADTVFSGSLLIAENGHLLADAQRFSMQNEMVVVDLDMGAMRHDRMRNSNIVADSDCGYRVIRCELDSVECDNIERNINAYPFVPVGDDAGDRLDEVFAIQTHGLAKRISHIGCSSVTIGVSGGLDSALALLVSASAFDLLGLSREGIYAVTMPGFGTTDRTYGNSVELIKSLGATVVNVPIGEQVSLHLKALGHDGKTQDVVYENAQARERMQILMDYSNRVNGFVVGTGNMSELALGWTTYNGDHISMYGVNAGIPKTLIKSLTQWITDRHVSDDTRRVLNDILSTPYSPELIRNDNSIDSSQTTEDIIGPYELHDFFLYRMIRFGDRPSRIYILAKKAFGEAYSSDEILKWLRIFYNRFFANQFKRSCLPDGPKVGSIGLSPRADWRMPSDASVELWLEDLNQI